MVKEDLKESPFLIVWEATRACSLICDHCRVEAISRPHADQLTTEESYSLIDQVKRARPVLFEISGGDPLRRKDLNELIAYAVSQDLRIGLRPSATPQLLRADFEQLHRVGVRRMSLSIDGADEQSHDAFRGVPGSWKWTMKALEKACRACIPIEITTTVTHHNIGQFEQFVDLLEEIEPMAWTLSILVPTGEGKQKQLPSAVELEAFLNRLYKHAQLAPYEVKTTGALHYSRVVSQHNSESGNERFVPLPLRVNDGNRCLFVSHTGDVLPSAALPVVAGNIRDGDLSTIYHESEAFEELRDSSLLKGKCGYCEYNLICGGSRARAYRTTGDYLGADELCAYQPVSPDKNHESSTNTIVERLQSG